MYDQSITVLSELEDVREINVYTPLEHTLTGLHYDVKYRVCLYNGYYWLQSDSSYCKEFTLPSAVPLNDVTQYAVAEESDDLETIIKRYETYMDTTKPVLDFYSQNSNFYEIDGSSKIGEITTKIDNFLNV